MGIFKFGRKGKDVIDLGERFRKQKEKEEQMASSESTESSSSDSIAFFDSSSDSPGSDSEVLDLSKAPNERRKKLAKRILEITSKLEDLSNQIYHLQQRIEILEKKSNVRIE